MPWILGSPYGLELAVQAASNVNDRLARQQAQSLALQAQRDAQTNAAKQNIWNTINKTVKDKFDWNVNIGQTPAELERDKQRKFEAEQKALDRTSYETRDNARLKWYEEKQVEAATGEPAHVRAANAASLGIDPATYDQLAIQQRQAQAQRQQEDMLLMRQGYSPDQIDAWRQSKQAVFQGNDARQGQAGQAQAENSQLAALQGQPVDLQSMNPVPQPNVFGQDSVANSPMLQMQRRQQNDQVLNKFAQLDLSDSDKARWRDYANMESAIEANQTLDPIRKQMLLDKVAGYRESTTQKWIPRSNPAQDKAQWESENTIDLGPDGKMIPSVSKNGVELRPIGSEGFKAQQDDRKHQYTMQLEEAKALNTAKGKVFERLATGQIDEIEAGRLMQIIQTGNLPTNGTIGQRPPRDFSTLPMSELKDWMSLVPKGKKDPTTGNDIPTDPIERYKQAKALHDHAKGMSQLPTNQVSSQPATTQPTPRISPGISLYAPSQTPNDGTYLQVPPTPSELDPSKELVSKLATLTTRDYKTGEPVFNAEQIGKLPPDIPDPRSSRGAIDVSGMPLSSIEQYLPSGTWIYRNGQLARVRRTGGKVEYVVQGKDQ
jgi:hypothetical protein